MEEQITQIIYTMKQISATLESVEVKPGRKNYQTMLACMVHLDRLIDSLDSLNNDLKEANPHHNEEV